jgi:tyrosyl-tRNA synthetase
MSGLINLKELFITDISDLDITNLVNKKSTIIVYDFFEPNERVHVGQAVIKANLWKKLISLGLKIVLCVGDWISLLLGLSIIGIYK